MKMSVDYTEVLLFFFLFFCFSLNEGQCHKNLDLQYVKAKTRVGRNVLTTSSNKQDKDTFVFCLLNRLLDEIGCQVFNCEHELVDLRTAE